MWHYTRRGWTTVLLVSLLTFGLSGEAQAYDYIYSDFWQEENDDFEDWDDTGAMMFAFGETQSSFDEDWPAATEIDLEHADGSRCYNAQEYDFFARADCQLFLPFGAVEGEIVAVSIHWALRLFGRFLGRLITRGTSGPVSASYIRSEEPNPDGYWVYENNFCVRRCTWRTAYFFTVDRGRYMNHRGRYTRKGTRVSCNVGYRFQNLGVSCNGPF